MGKEFTVFFDCHSFDTGWQGTTTYLAGVLNALPKVAAHRAPNLDLRIVCAAQDEDAIRRCVVTDFDFVPIRSGFFYRNVIDIPKALRKTRADLVVSQYVRPLFSSCPTMSVIHDVLFLDFPESFSWTYRTVRKLLFGWSARQSSFVSTVSRYSAERIAAHYRIDQSRILIIPNGVDPDFIAAEKQPQMHNARSTMRLLSVSRLEKRKRHEWGIVAIDALAEDGIDSKLTIVGGGDGDYAAELRALVEEARVERGRHITLKSGLSIEELVNEYTNTDLFLFPSEAEGFGIPIIEAAAAGLPCVCSNGGALEELEGQFSGISFLSGDAHAFLVAVRTVAANLEDYRTAAAKKRKMVAATYNWESAAEAYLTLMLGLQRGTK